MSEFGSILRCFNDDRPMIERCVHDAKGRLFDSVDSDLRAMGPDVANDPLVSSYRGVIEQFVSRAEMHGFVEQTGDHCVINDEQVSEVFEDLILSISHFSHVNNIYGAKAVLAQLSEDVLFLNTFNHNDRAATLLLSHYQSDIGRDLRRSIRAQELSGDDGVVGSHGIPEPAVAAPS